VIALNPQLRVLVAVAPVDFRAGIDGLAQRIRQVPAAEPMSGALFVFRNRRGTAVKLLAYDGQGFWLCHKRLSQWPSRIGRRLSRGRSWRPDHLGTITAALLRLLERYGTTELAAAIDDALARGVPHPKAVRLALERRREARVTPAQPSLGLPLPPAVTARDRPIRPHALTDYDRLSQTDATPKADHD